MRYRIGRVEYDYNEDEHHGVVITDSRTYIRENPYELLNIFMNEIERRLRYSIRDKLTGTNINPITGTETGKEISDTSSC